MIGTPNKQAEKTKTVDHCGPVTLVNNDDKPKNPQNLKICHPCLLTKTMSSKTGWSGGRSLPCPSYAPTSCRCGVSYLYFMKNTGNVTNTQNIEFKCENPRNKDIDIIYV